jgi:integrase
MPKLALTDRAVDKLETPVDKHITYWDTRLPGFGVRVSPKGRKTWIAQYRIAGDSVAKTETIGTTALLSKVADARELAQVSLLQAKQGINPVGERRQKQAADKAAAAAQALTFAKLAARYLTDYVEPNCKPRSIDEIARLLAVAARFFGDKPVHTISKGDVLALISQPPRKGPRVARTGGRTEQSNWLKVVKQVFRWAIDRDLVTADPSAAVKPPLTKKGERDRVLTDSEIVAFWQGCDALGYPFGPLFKLLLLTGQRLREVSDSSWGEIGDLEDRTWHLPGGLRTKNGQKHDVHLSDAALAIIEALPRIAPLPRKPAWLFSMTGERPVCGFMRAKAQLVARMEVDDWCLHDLRRTATTIMARLGVAPHVADRVLNHTAGTIKGVAAVYNRFDYCDERAAALDALGRFVTGLVHPETAPANVVALRASA